MKFRRLSSAVALAFCSMKTVFPVILLIRLLDNAITILFPGVLPEDEIIDARNAAAPFLLLIFGGLLAYRLTGIAAANSVGRKTAALGVTAAAVPVSALFAAVDLLTVKLCISGIYGKPAVCLLEPISEKYVPEVTGHSYGANGICSITDINGMLFLFLITMLLYFWALLAGYVTGLFITHRCKVRLTLMVITMAASVGLYYTMVLRQNVYWGIGILFVSLINPVIFVYGTLVLTAWAVLSGMYLAPILLSACAVSFITLGCNMLLIKPNVPVYSGRRKR